MNRLGDLDGAATPSVNADMVDDIHAVDLMPGGNPPAGMTIRGAWATNGGDGELVWSSHSFGYELSTAPTPHFLPADAAATTECPGSPTNPEAAMGHLCVYESSASVGGNPSFDCIFGPTSSFCSTTTRTGFGISQFGSGAAWLSGGTWAVTEPLIFVIPLSEPEGDGRSPFEPPSD